MKQGVFTPHTMTPKDQGQGERWDSGVSDFYESSHVQMLEDIINSHVPSLQNEFHGNIFFSFS